MIGWIEPLYSLEKLYELKVVDYPHLEKSARTKIHKGLYKAANPTIIDEEAEAKALTVEDLARIIGG